jgi:hypothetical protein
MKQTLTLYDFEHAFEDMGRKDQFSYDGLRVLFDFFEQFDADCGTDTEIDVIAICCEFSEATAEEVAENYGYNLSGMSEEEGEEFIKEQLEYYTTLCGETSDCRFVYADF